jgi:hypothetical protein
MKVSAFTSTWTHSRGPSCIPDGGSLHTPGMTPQRANDHPHRPQSSHPTRRTPIESPDEVPEATEAETPAPARPKRSSRPSKWPRPKRYLNQADPKTKRVRTIVSELAATTGVPESALEVLRERLLGRAGLAEPASYLARIVRFQTTGEWLTTNLNEPADDMRGEPTEGGDTPATGSTSN